MVVTDHWWESESFGHNCVDLDVQDSHQDAVVAQKLLEELVCQRDELSVQMRSQTGTGSFSMVSEVRYLTSDWAVFVLDLCDIARMCQLGWQYRSANSRQN